MENVEIAKDLLRSFMQFRRIAKGPPTIDGLKHNEIGILFLIKGGCESTDGGMKVSELSGKMRVTSPFVTQLVTSMEEKGLVERRMDRDDRRSVNVRLTEKGLEITKAAEEHLLGMMTGLVDHLGAEKSLQLVEITREIFQYLASHNQFKGVE